MDASVKVLMALDTVTESAEERIQESIQKVYAQCISAELNGRHDLMIDFTCLQMCLDPQSELSLFTLSEDEKVRECSLTVL